jgi:NitT/TauT family transport system substrate-binding protein
MRCRIGAVIAALWLGALASAGSTAAETRLRLWRPVDLAALPLLIVEHEKLIEKEADSRGLGRVAITWSVPGKSGALEALDSGEIDGATADLVPFLVAADAGAGTPRELRALTALMQRPYVLVTRNPAVHTIRDFTAADRIAVPALKTSGPAVLLELAAAQEWGEAQYEKLAAFVVARPDAAAAAGLVSGKGDINAHFSRSPYADDELANPAIRRLMDSFDIAGPHSATLLVMTARFRDANPALCAALLAALQQADALIKDNPGQAAEIYLAISKDPDLLVEDLTDMIGEPDLAYMAAPAGVKRLADFMHRIGRLKRPTGAWQDWFFPEAHGLSGS